MKNFTEKQKTEIQEIADEYKISFEIAQHAYGEMLENFELTDEEAISSYWLEKGEEPPKQFGGKDRKKRASIQEIKERDASKLKAQEVKKMRDDFKAMLEIQVKENLLNLGYVMPSDDGKKTTVEDELGFSYEIKIVATRPKK